jgi:hypothetical protein
MEAGVTNPTKLLEGDYKDSGGIVSQKNKKKLINII